MAARPGGMGLKLQPLPLVQLLVGAVGAVMGMETSLGGTGGRGQGMREDWVWCLPWLLMANPARCSWHGTAWRLQRKIAFLGCAHGLRFQAGLGLKVLDAAVEIAGVALWSAAGDGWQRWAAEGRDHRALSSSLCESAQAGQCHLLYF